MTASRPTLLLVGASLVSCAALAQAPAPGWAEVPVFKIDGVPAAPLTLQVTPPKRDRESPGSFGADHPAKVIVEVTQPTPGLVVLVKLNPWSEFFTARSAFTGEPKTAKATGGYTANGKLDIDGATPGKYAVDVWLKSTQRSIPFTLVAYAPGTQRDPLALAGPVAPDLPLEGRAVFSHFPGLSIADLEDIGLVQKLLEKAPKELFVFLAAGPLEGEVTVAKNEPLLFLGEAQQLSALTADGERVFPSKDQLSLTKPAKVVLPAKVRKGYPRAHSDADRKLVADLKAAEDQFNECITQKRTGTEEDGPMGDVEAASVCGADALDAKKAAGDKKLEAADLAKRSAGFNAIKKRLTALMAK